METNYKGIDYGLGHTNIDHKNNIRYGVIPVSEITQAWADNSEMEYGNPTCPICGNEVIDYDDEIHENYKAYTDFCCFDYVCETCEFIFDNTDVFPQEPDGFYYESGGYRAYQGNDDFDIFIEKSDYYTYAQFCSPCAPGAGYLLNPLTEKDENNKTYCLHHNWFENEIAPYPVYSVETGKEIKAERKNVPCKFCNGKGTKEVKDLAFTRNESIADTIEFLNNRCFELVIDNDHFKCFVCKGKKTTEKVVYTEV